MYTIALSLCVIALIAALFTFLDSGLFHSRTVCIKLAVAALICVPVSLVAGKSMGYPDWAVVTSVAAIGETLVFALGILSAKEK